MSLLKRIDKGSAGAGGERETGQPPAEPGVSASPAPRNAEDDVKDLVQQRLLNEIGPGETFDLTKSEELRNRIDELFKTILADEGIVLAKNERKRLRDQIVADIVGFGPLEPLLEDTSITDIMVNTPQDIYVVRKGIVRHSEVSFEGEEHLLTVLNRMLATVGERCDAANPIVETRLPGDLHVNAVLRPIAISGPTVTIRKFGKVLLTLQRLIDYGSATVEVMEFLRACVFAGANIVVSGGGGSGKTTLINVLSSFIAAEERVVTIEHHIAELRLDRKQVIPLISRPGDRHGQSEVTIGDLVRNSVFMRPDRLVVGEWRGGEALYLLQMMATGYSSMATVHSNSPHDTLSRLEMMCLMANMDMPTRAIREMIASAVNLIVHVERLKDGSRKVVAVAEVQGIESGVITLANIFQFEKTGVEGKKVVGHLRPTGLRPKILNNIEDSGIRLPLSIFGLEADTPGKA